VSGAGGPRRAVRRAAGLAHRALRGRRRRGAPALFRSAAAPGRHALRAGADGARRHHAVRPGDVDDRPGRARGDHEPERAFSQPARAAGRNRRGPDPQARAAARGRRGDHVLRRRRAADLPRHGHLRHPAGGGLSDGPAVLFAAVSTVSVIGAAKRTTAMDTTAGRTPALVVNDLHKRFGSLEVLKGVSLTAATGDVISMIGSSGSGKSTLLRCINLLETPDAGEVYVGGELIRMVRTRQGARPADHKQVDRIRTRLGMVFQSFNLWSHMTVLENVIEATVHVLKVPRAKAIGHAEALLAKA